MTKSKGIPCPVCGKSTKVRRTVERQGYISRRRKCSDGDCTGMISTTERVPGSTGQDKRAVAAEEIIADMLKKAEFHGFLELPAASS